MAPLSKKILILAVLAAALAACDYYQPKGLKEPIVRNVPTHQEPLEPTFRSIQKLILNVQCVSCHSPLGEAKQVPLSTLADLIDSPRELVLPGNVEESGLMIALLRTDDKRMPPPKTGGPLTDDEIRIIRLWIEEGAKP